MGKEKLSRFFKRLNHYTKVCLSFCFNFSRIYVLKFKRIPLIAIVKVEHFGDIVLSEPVSRYAREKHPNAHIIWVAKELYNSLLKHNTHIDSVVDVHCLTEAIWLMKSGIFDEVINLHENDRSCQICRFPKNKSTEPMEFLDIFKEKNHLAAFTKAAGIHKDFTESPLVYIPDSIIRSVDRLNLPAHFIAVHCISNDRSKNWEKDYWIDLIERINAEFKLPIFEVGLNSIFDDELEHISKYCGKLELLETAELIRRATIFIGVDSGVAHFANAFAIPGVVFFGNYYGATHYMPYTGNYTNPDIATIITNDAAIEEITVNEVFSAVKKRLLNILEKLP